MKGINEWIQHLRYPLVVAGFVLYLFTEYLHAKDITGDLAVVLLFILALSIIILSGVAFYLSWKSKGQAAASVRVEQQTKGGKSPAINSQGDVQIHYGGMSSSSEKAEKKASATEQQAVPSQVTQSTEGEKSPAINSQGDVEINYAE